MTPAEFDAAASRTQVSGKYARCARLVLVDGYSCPDALAIAGESVSANNKSALRRVVANIRPALKGWRSVTIYYPPELEGAVRDIKKQARRASRC